MTATPAPGDLKARLHRLHDLFERINEDEDGDNYLNLSCDGMDETAAAIAALSALSAGGGAVFYARPGLIENCQAIAGVQSRHRVVLSTEPEDGYTVPFYTTPQPSADERAQSGFNDRPNPPIPRDSLRVPNDGLQVATAADAAVVAQGDGDDYAARIYIRDWCPDHVKDYIARLAAPAAGKGVDELPTKWRKDADSLEDHARQIREQELSREVELLMARAATKRMDADALEAALTRQPVAEKSALDHYCDGTGFIGP